MKKLIIILSLILTTFVTNAQIVKPDTLQLSPKELFGESGNWNNLGILESYIDFSKDVLSSSNLSVGYKKSNPILFMIGTNFQF